MDDEAGNRFKHLLAPCKDMFKNFNIDIKTELITYQNEIGGLANDFDYDEYKKFNFAEAGMLISGTTSIYSRKVDYVHQSAYTFSDSLKTSKKKKGADDQDDDDDDFGGGGEENSEEGVPKKRRVRAHDGDPCSFQRRKVKHISYDDHSERARLVNREFIKSKMKAEALPEPPLIITLSSELRAVPDNEKEGMCVLGVFLKKIEAIGKYEDFWSMSYATSTQERQWTPNRTLVQLPIHAAKPGGCKGCADETCSDCDYFQDAYIPREKVKFFSTIPKRKLYMDYTDCLIIRRKYIDDFAWSRVPDLIARANLWQVAYDKIQKERLEDKKIMDFALEHIQCPERFTRDLVERTNSAMSSQPFSQGTQGTVSSQHTVLTAQSQKLSQNDDDDDGWSDDGVSPTKMKVAGVEFRGRNSSRMSSASGLSRMECMRDFRPSMGPRSSTRLSAVELLEDDRDPQKILRKDSIAFEDRGGLLSMISNGGTMINGTIYKADEKKKEINPWSVDACNEGIGESKTARRDPFDTNDQLTIVPTKKLSRRQQCVDSEKLRKQQIEKFTQMPRGARNMEIFNFINTYMEAIPGQSSQFDDANWMKTVSQYGETFVRAAKRLQMVKKRSSKRVLEQQKIQETPEPQDGVMDNNRQTMEIYGAFDDIDGFEDDDLDFDEDLPMSEGIDFGQKFADMDREDYDCPLIDVNVLAPSLYSQQSDGGRSIASAYDTLLKKPGKTVEENLNIFLMNAKEYEDKRSQMQKEVQDWEDMIVPLLEEEESHKKFNIHSYGGEVLDKFSKVGQTKRISEFAHHKEKYEVSRVFLSVLMMANTNNVEIGHDPANPINSMTVKLLNKDRPHEKLAEDGCL